MLPVARMHPRSTAGFSLVEVLVASAIFVGGVASILQLVAMAVSASAAARYRTEGAMLATQKVEELRVAPWGTEGGGSDQRSGYARRWTVQPLAVNPQSAIAIEVLVTHAGGEPVRVLTVKSRTTP